MQRHECYKSCDIQWISAIPKHWDAQRAKWLFDRKERPPQPDDGVVTAFRDGQVTLRTNRRTEGFTNAIQEHGYQGIRKGDLVIHAMDAFAGAIGVSDSDGKSTPVYAACVPRGEYPVNSYYYAYLLRYMAHSGYIESLSKGIRERSTDFRFAEFREQVLPVPPKNEQDRIVNVLDRKTDEINAAIEKKKRLIELLQEQKSILINQAVTNGLNLKASMRKDGVSWADRFPEHWPVKYLKHLFKEVDFRTTTGEEPLFSLRMSGQLIRHKEVSDKPITSEQLIGYKVVQPGQLVMNRMRASMGLFAVAKEHGLVSPDYAVFDIISDISQEYFWALFRNSAIKGTFLTESKGLGTGSSGFLRLYSDRFGGIKVPCPPLVEQKKIVAAIDSLSKQFKVVENPIALEIQNLQEMRSALIAAVVTGKIKI